jgi:DNA-binding response OmpR family regulator
MEFLKREGNHADAPRPDLILLDLDLPKKDGREVLKEIMESPTLGTIPVVILTSCAADEHMLKRDRFPATCYIAKPLAPDKFLKIVRSIDNFWLSVVKLPREGSPIAHGAAHQTVSSSMRIRVSPPTRTTSKSSPKTAKLRSEGRCGLKMRKTTCKPKQSQWLDKKT